MTWCVGIGLTVELLTVIDQVVLFSGDYKYTGVLSSHFPTGPQFLCNA